jgi:hypothetical protein
MENRHRATLEVLQWKDVRNDVKDHALVEVIGQLSPGKKFPLYKIKYPFGAMIVHRGELYLPTSDGDVEPISSSKIPDDIRKNVNNKNMPALLMLKNKVEMFYEMPERVISGYVMSPGKFIGLWEQLDPSNSEYIKWAWSVVSGVRTTYMLPSISEVNGHKNLREKDNISAQAPKNYTDQWRFFVELANSQNFSEEWSTELLCFTNPWFDMAEKDEAWQNWRNFLLNVAWEESTYWRAQSRFGLIWEEFIHQITKTNIKTKLYLSFIVKQLILTGIGGLPGLSIATDDSAGPILALQKAYIEDYKLKDYIPTIMQSHCFSFTDKYPIYYSLQQPNLLETLPINQHIESILNVIPEIQYLLGEFKEKVAKTWLAKNTLVEKFYKNVECDYFHYNKAPAGSQIKHTTEMSRYDSRVLCTPNKETNRLFACTSKLLCGCVSFRNKK